MRARMSYDLSDNKCRSTVAKLEKPKYIIVKTLGSSTRCVTSSARCGPVLSFQLGSARQRSG